MQRPSEPSVPGGPTGPERDPGGLRELRYRAAIRRIGRWSAAIVLTAVAIFFGFVPGIPGVPFMVVALLLVAPDWRRARELAARMQRKFPRFRRMIPKRWRRTKGDAP